MKCKAELPSTHHYLLPGVAKSFPRSQHHTEVLAVALSLSGLRYLGFRECNMVPISWGVQSQGNLKGKTVRKSAAFITNLASGLTNLRQQQEFFIGCIKPPLLSDEGKRC